MIELFNYVLYIIIGASLGYIAITVYRGISKLFYKKCLHCGYRSKILHSGEFLDYTYIELCEGCLRSFCIVKSMMYHYRNGLK
jgi:hypothetical protein